MTQLKTGDRVVPEIEQAFYLIKEANDMIMDLRIKAPTSPVNGEELYAVQMKLFEAMDCVATPVKPKWEPKIGDIVEATNYKIESEMPWIKGRYIGMDDEYYIIKRSDATTYHAYLNIRPIAPSIEEELEKILEGVTFEVTRGETIKLIMQWHNRHKEGEGR